MAGIIKRGEDEEVIFKERREMSEQMKTEVGGQREERQNQAYPVSRQTQTANNSTAAVLVERGTQAKKRPLKP